MGKEDNCEGKAYESDIRAAESLQTVNEVVNIKNVEQYRIFYISEKFLTKKPVIPEPKIRLKIQDLKNYWPSFPNVVYI